MPGVSKQIAPSVASLAASQSTGLPEPAADPVAGILSGLRGGQLGAEQILLLLSLLSGGQGLPGMGAPQGPQAGASPIEAALLGG